MPQTLDFTIDSIDGPTMTRSVSVQRIFNFGYAGRDQDDVRAHIDEMAGLSPLPENIPAVFPLPPDRVSGPGTITVSGDVTYGEVEFALVFTGDTWLVTIASDHSDAGVEQFSTPRAKACCPDVVGAHAWHLDEVLERWDECTLRLEAHGPAGTEVVQEGSAVELLDPNALIAILGERLDGDVEPGTVVLSGTIAGAPRTGFTSWTATLGSPTRPDLVLKYAIDALPDEI